MNYTHNTVLLNETVDSLDIKPNGVYVDATMGGGGHSLKICEQLSEDGTFIGIDQDDFAQNYAQERLKDTKCKKIFIKSNFSNLKEELDKHNIHSIDGIIYDLGVSSFQLDDQDRGFSYHHDGPLDMRMDRTTELTAFDIVNNYSQRELAKIIRDYGEEKFANQIAKKIVDYRNDKEIKTTEELSEIVRSAYPPKARFKGKHPARKTFQALRIEVNKELSILEPSFTQAIELLNQGGKIAVITFHSLEDRITKHFFKNQVDPCTCPPDFPICVCGNKPTIKLVNRKPILPSKEEVEENNRARSAKLRVAEKL